MYICRTSLYNVNLAFATQKSIIIDLQLQSLIEKRRKGRISKWTWWKKKKKKNTLPPYYEKGCHVAWFKSEGEYRKRYERVDDGEGLLTAHGIFAGGHVYSRFKGVICVGGETLKYKERERERDGQTGYSPPSRLRESVTIHTPSSGELWRKSPLLRRTKAKSPSTSRGL